MTDWIKIDDPERPAPKDGTHILLWSITPTFDEDRRRMTTETCAVVGYWVFGQFVEFPFRNSVLQGQQFTHWMPLPPPPHP